MSIKKLAAAAGLVAGLAVLAPSTAYAGDTGAQVRTVNPGQTVCVQDPGFGYTNARGELSVTSGHPVRVTFGTYSPATRTLFDSVQPVSAAAPQVYSFTNPAAFPGRFQICAVNQSLKVSYVQMRVIAS